MCIMCNLHFMCDNRDHYGLCTKLAYTKKSEPSWQKKLFLLAKFVFFCQLGKLNL